MSYKNPEAMLLDMLTYKRPHDSDHESLFVQKFIIEPHQQTHKLDIVGPMRNIVITVDEKSETLFSCHTDTVHFKDGFQEVVFDSNIAYAYKRDNECLGADDTTGVWLMLKMIEAQVPGTYVFHRGEERGGIGSRWMADNRQEWLKRFKRAVALDRKGETSVITSQRGMRCCSDEFADALCKELGEDWEPDDTGTFTDTANYTHLIPECTNLSIGYYDQHTKDEQQNVDFALALIDALIKIDWEALPTKREAKRETWVPRSFTPRSFAPPGFQRSFEDDDYGFGGSYGRGATEIPAAVTPAQASLPKQAAFKDFELTDDYHTYTLDELTKLSLKDLYKLCKDDALFATVKLRELLEDRDASFNTITELTELVADAELETSQAQDKTSEVRQLYATAVANAKELQKHNQNLITELATAKSKIASLERKRFSLANFGAPKSKVS